MKNWDIVVLVALAAVLVGQRTRPESVETVCPCKEAEIGLAGEPQHVRWIPPHMAGGAGQWEVSDGSDVVILEPSRGELLEVRFGP